MEPVPAGLKTMSSLLRVAAISLPTNVKAPVDKGPAYSSVNMVFTFSMAARKVSPVPSFAVDPMFKVNCAILYVHYPPHEFDYLIVCVIYCS